MRSIHKIFLCLLVAGLFAALLFAGMGNARADVGANARPSSTPLPDLPINPNLPGTNTIPISGEGGQGPAGLVANFYSFAFLLAGFLAFVMIIYGGVRYTFSGGNHSAQSDAKEAIKQAMLGLGLLLVAYLILRTINPDLTTLKLPTLAPYVAPVGAPVGRATTTPPGQCASGTCAPITGFICKNGCTADLAMVRVLQCMSKRTGFPPGRITEAMPPSSPHKDPCHNNGCCVDMTLASERKDDCSGVQAMINAANACGAKGVLNEYFSPDSPCGGKNTEYSTGVHIHVAAC